MSPVTIVLLVILAVLIAATIALYFLGKKAQKRKDEQDAQLAATAQTVTMLIIDKKRMRLNQSGLPQAVIDQTPKLMRRSKLPIVKAKVGPKVMTLIADDACFDMIHVKKQVLLRLEKDHIPINHDIEDMVEFIMNRVFDTILQNLEDPFDEVFKALNIMDKFMLCLVISTHYSRLKLQ